jgi:hypothetical protein
LLKKEQTTKNNNIMNSTKNYQRYILTAINTETNLTEGYAHWDYDCGEWLITASIWNADFKFSLRRAKVTLKHIKETGPTSSPTDGVPIRWEIQGVNMGSPEPVE